MASPEQAIDNHPQSYNDPTIEDLEQFEQYAEAMLEHLQALLFQHNVQNNLDELVHPGYHAHIYICLAGQHYGQPIIRWDCHYCRYLYNTARYFNHHINKAQAQKLTIQPTLGIQPSSTEMIDPLACPFLPIPTQDLRNFLILLQNQAGHRAVPSNTPPQVDEKLPST